MEPKNEVAPDYAFRIGLSTLGENPRRKTGLTTAYEEFVARSLKLFPQVSWVVFVGPEQPWPVSDPRVDLVRRFPANDKLERRIWADHLLVPAEARVRGADVLFSTGFVPMRKCLPTVLNVVSLQHLHSSNGLSLARRFYRRWMTRYSWPKADLVITNSRCASAQLLSIFPEARGRVIQAYEGLQHERFHPFAATGEAAWLKERTGLDPGYLLWVSNFYPYKQANRLLAAYGLLDVEFRRRHPLVMVGGDWENTIASCRNQMRKMDIERDVQLLGWVDDTLLAPLYRHACLHCLPSREETFGRTVIEAMACGTPVLANDIPVLREVTDGAARLVSFDDPARVAQTLRQITEEDALRATLRAAGLARAQQFSFEKFAIERIMAIQQLVTAVRTRR